MSGAFLLLRLLLALVVCTPVPVAAQTINAPGGVAAQTITNSPITFGLTPPSVRQMCLAHLLRDATYAIDEGDEGFALGFRFLLLRAVAIGRRRDALKDSTLAQYHGDLERRAGPVAGGRRA